MNTTRAAPWRSRRAATMGLLALAASACAPAAQDDTVTVAIWGSSPGELRAFDTAAAAFTRATGIKVVKQVIEDKYMDVIKSRFAGRRPPDALYLDGFEAPVLIKSGVLEPLDAELDDVADFHPQLLAAFRGEDGKLYGLPKDYSTLALYLNPALLKAAGFKPAQVPRDFTGLMDFARRLQARLPRGVAAMLIEKDLARHLAALEAGGPPVVLPDGGLDFSANPQVRRYLQQLVDGRAGNYLYSPKEDLGADWPGAAFGSGRAAMMMEGNWVLPALRQDYAGVPFLVREMPTVNGKPQTMAFVVGYAVPRGARNRAGGLRFARFMSGAGMRTWATLSGTLPARRSVEAAMGLASDPTVGPHVAGAAYATVWSRGPGLPIINTNFGNGFLAAFNRRTPLDQALRDLERVSRREIERQQ